MSDVEVDERTVQPGLLYGDGEPVRVRIRRRGHRYDIDDDGQAWRKARASGRAALARAEQVVTDEGFNVTRSGVVFVPAVEGRDIDGLAARLADCSRYLHAALLELDEHRLGG
jgi:hypothetical protein